MYSGYPTRRATKRWMRTRRVGSLRREVGERWSGLLECFAVGRWQADPGVLTPGTRHVARPLPVPGATQSSSSPASSLYPSGAPQPNNLTSRRNMPDHNDSYSARSKAMKLFRHYKDQTQPPPNAPTPEIPKTPGLKPALPPPPRTPAPGNTTSASPIAPTIPSGSPLYHDFLPRRKLSPPADRQAPYRTRNRE